MARSNPFQPQPGERQVVGKAGTVAVLDARLWHPIAPNKSSEDRVAVIVRYAPWWLSLAPLRPGTTDRADIVEANKGKESAVAPLPREIYEHFPDEVKPMLHHN